LLPDWLGDLKAEVTAFKFTGYEIGATRERFPWKKRREWPPPGKDLVLHFHSHPPMLSALKQINKSLEFLSGVAVDVHYEIYNGIPLICKWITVKNNSSRAFTLQSFTSEIIAVVEAESQVDDPATWRFPRLAIETDYAFGGGMSVGTTSKSVCWLPDPNYTSQVNYNRIMPCLLECRPQYGPDQVIHPG